MTYSYSFWLPFPPSVNRIWRKARGRMILSEKYREWKDQADRAGHEQKLGNKPVLGRYTIDVRLSDAFRRNSDAENRLKTIPDWCQRVKLIVNDKNCLNASIGWNSDIEHDCVVTLCGEIAFADKDEFARHQMAARKRASRKVSSPVLTLSGVRFRLR